MTEVQARTVLWYLVFIGFAVNYMIRINLNITIVEMISVKSNSPTQSPVTLDEDLELTSNESYIESNVWGSKPVLPFQEKAEKMSLEKIFLNWSGVRYDAEGFNWNEYERGLVLGSFFYVHWITQIPGGILAKKYGTKLVFGLSNAIGCWMCFFIPIASYWDYRILIVLRILQGLITGLAWPAMHVMTAQWIPPNERSKFVTAYLGSSVGIGVFYPFFGFLMHWWAWEWVYYICGLIGTAWYLGWLIYVFDTPAEHPRISQKEVTYIEKSLGASVQGKSSAKTPWRAVLTSCPVWMNVIAQWGGIWGLFTLMTQAPTYFRVVHQFDIRQTGVLSGFPHLMRMLFAYLFSILADYWLRTDKMSRTNLRKLATAICCIVKGFIVLALAYYGYSTNAAVILLTVATMVHGAVSSGPLASIVDIAPNYAGIVLGISGMVGVLPGFISPYIVGILTLNNQTFEAWKNVFLICAFMLIGSGVLYVLFGDSSLQPWNNYDNKTDKQLDQEMQMLSEKQEKIETKSKLSLKS